MSKGGGVSGVDVPWEMRQAALTEAQVAQQAMQMAQEQWKMGKERTAKYADPILNQMFGTLATSTGGANEFTNLVNTSMMQYPVWATGQQYDAARKQIMDQVPPGPQQTALLSNLSNQRMQGLGSQAYSQVSGMINSLLGQSGAWATGGGLATGSYGTAAGAAGQMGQIGGQIANIQAMNQNLQLQAQQSGNQLLGSVFGTIGTLAGYGMGSGFLGKMMGI